MCVLPLILSACSTLAGLTTVRQSHLHLLFCLRLIVNVPMHICVYFFSLVHVCSVDGDNETHTALDLKLVFPS